MLADMRRKTQNITTRNDAKPVTVLKGSRGAWEERTFRKLARRPVVVHAQFFQPVQSRVGHEEPPLWTYTMLYTAVHSCSQGKQDPVSSK